MEQLIRSSITVDIPEPEHIFDHHDQDGDFYDIFFEGKPCGISVKVEDNFEWQGNWSDNAKEQELQGDATAILTVPVSDDGSEMTREEWLTRNGMSNAQLDSAINRAKSAAETYHLHWWMDNN